MRITFVLFLCLLSDFAYASGPYLLHAKKNGKITSWEVVDAESRKSRVLLKTEEEPEYALFDLKSMLVYLEGNDAIWAGPLKGNHSKTVFPLLGSGCSRHAWALHPKSRNLMLAMDCQKAINEDGEEVETKVANEILHSNGKQFSVVGTGPLFYFQLDKNKKWKAISQVDWGESAKDVYDFGADLFSEVTCEATKCSDTFKKIPKAAKKNLVALLKKEGRNEKDFLPGAYMPFGKSSGMLYGADEGDTMHGMAPAYLCLKKCEEIYSVGVEGFWGHGGQISVSKKSDFLLVAGEYDGKQGLVFRDGEANPYLDFQKSKLVTWLPSDLLWRLAK